MRNRTLQRCSIQKALATKGWNCVDLANALKYRVGTIYNVIGNRNSSAVARRKIEAALGVVIWPPSTSQNPTHPTTRQ